MSQHVKYLLVGGGVASSEAAAAIRGLDERGEILLVGQEINRPYHRPPLSRQFLLGKLGRDALFTHDSHWFEQNHVQLRSGRRVSELDVGRQAATLDSGEIFSFDELLIATGASVAPLRVPGANLPNLFYLRTLEDAERLRHAIDKARHDGRRQPDDPAQRGRAAIIGGGLLGVELAGTLRQAGLQIELILAHQHPWSRLVGPAIGRAAMRFLGRQGVKIHCDAPATALEGDGRVQRMMLASGVAIDCDFAVAAVGRQINKDLLRGAPIAAERAVLVDVHCRTNLPHVHAAGDCAAVFDPRFGKHRAIEHWDAAALSGRVAGTVMAGGEATFDDVIAFETESLGLQLSIYGEARLVDRRIVREISGNGSPDFIEFGVAADGRIAQVAALGHPGDTDILADCVRKRVAIDGGEERFKDPAVPLSSLLG